MKQILFPLVLLLVSFYISPLLGIIASAVFLVYAALRFLPNFYAIKGNKHYNAGDVNLALKYYKKAIKTNRASDKIKLYYAIMLLRNGYPEDAERIFDAVVMSKTVKAEDKLTARQFRCMAYYKQGRIGEAMEDTREIFAEVKNTTTYSLMGLFMHVANTPADELLTLCREAFEYNPDERDIADNYLLALVKNDDYKQGLEIGYAIIEKHPKFIEGYVHTAMCEKALGNKAKARELLEKVDSCNRTYLTTVSEDEISALLREVSEGA